MNPGYVCGLELMRPFVEAGMYLEEDTQTFYIGVAFERMEVGPQTWEPYVITSQHQWYLVDNQHHILLDRTTDVQVAVRRAHPLRLGGLLDEHRLSKDGVNRIVGGAESPLDLAERLEKKLREYAVLPEEWQYLFVAVWIVATYLYKLFPVFPFLLLMSKNPGSGKSKLLAVLERVCFNATKSNCLTAAGLRRISEGAPGTVLVDEFEAIGKDRLEGSELNEVLNSKFDADARASILVPVKGGGWKPSQFKLFSPMVIAKLAAGSASDTVIDRSIVIRMRKLKGAFQQEHPKYDKDWGPLRDDLYLWALRNWEQVGETYRSSDEVRQGLNRKGDIWRVVLSVARHLLSEEAYRQLLTQATAPEPTFDEDDIPEDYEPIIDLLDDLRALGVEKVKASYLRDQLGDKLAPHLRADKAFGEALRELAESQKITVKPFGKGKTLHIFFWEKPLPRLSSQSED